MIKQKFFENITLKHGLSRRELSKLLWVTPIMSSIALPVHAQTSTPALRCSTAKLECRAFTSESTTVVPGGNITEIKANYSVFILIRDTRVPVFPAVALEVTTDDPNYPDLGTFSPAAIERQLTEIYPDISIPADIALGTTIKLQLVEASGIGLNPPQSDPDKPVCTSDEQVVFFELCEPLLITVQA